MSLIWEGLHADLIPRNPGVPPLPGTPQHAGSMIFLLPMLLSYEHACYVVEYRLCDVRHDEERSTHALSTPVARSKHAQARSQARH